MAIQVLTDVPPGELADIISDLTYQGLAATVTPQANGLLTVTALPPAATVPGSGLSGSASTEGASTADPTDRIANFTVNGQSSSNGGSPAWQELISSYRNYTGASDHLKIASLAQWILESGRGTSGLANQHLNFGGLKFRERMKGYASFVDYKGSDGDQTLYCKFSSVRAFIDGYWHFIDSGPYDGWNSYSNDGAAYIRFIGPNYAGDQAYVGKVLHLFEEAKSLLSLDNPKEIDRGAAADGTGGVFGKLAIVVGHNRVASGAFGASPIGRSEFDFNSVVASRMKDQASHYNLAAEVFIRQPSASYSQEIKDVYQRVRGWNPDCAIELHFNSSSDPSAGGTEVLYRNGSNDGRALASTLVDSIESLLGLPLRRGGTGLGPLSPGDRGAGSVYALEGVATALVEPFFGSNNSETVRVASLGEEALALSYLRGVRDWVVSKTLVS